MLKRTPDLESPAAALIAVVLLAGGCSLGGQGHHSFIITEAQLRAVAEMSEDEGEVERGAPEADAPSIIIEIPEPDSRVAAPVPVNIRFIPGPDATIVPETLQVRFGMFDITDKVREVLDVSADGITGSIDDAYPGKYKLKLQISDTLNRTAQATARFRVIRED